MKTLILFLIFTTPLFSQTHMNVLFSDDSYKNANIDEITEITFNEAGTEMTTTLSSGSSTDPLSDITEITFDGTGEGGGLPVELISFYADVMDGKITLYWATATEVNNYGFEIECNSNLEGFSTIGFVEGHGNSNSPKEYSFVVTSVAERSRSYRLKQIDTDGSFEYSETITIELGVPTEYTLKQNYPNPFNPTTKIEYSLPQDGFVTLKVYTALGELVTTLVNEDQKAGNYMANFSKTNGLSSGIYIARMVSGNYSEIIKMILIK